MAEVQDETIILIFVELNRFRKKLEDCHSVIDKWCHTMKNIRWMDCLPAELQTEVFERFFRACEIAKFTPEQKLEYENDMMTERDDINSRMTERRIGREEERYEIAAKLKASGMAEKEIVMFTGLSEEQVRAL